MSNHASEFMRRQQRMAMSTTFEAALTAAWDAIAVAPAVNNIVTTKGSDPRRLAINQRNVVFTRCQRLDMNQRGLAIAAKKMGTTGWWLFWADDGATKEILLIGKWDNDEFTGAFSDWFAWTVSKLDNAVLQGLWTPPEGRDNSIDMAYPGPLKFDHENKHFGHKPAEAQFTIGTPQTRKNIVAGMEEKAIAQGMILGGEAFFRFNVNVGTDGQKPRQSASASIRVDTPGGPSQHSHPIPESEAGMVSHDGKVKSAIRTHTVARDLDALLDLAKYLRVIGGSGYTNLRADAHLYGTDRPPASTYWAW